MKTITPAEALANEWGTRMACPSELAEMAMAQGHAFHAAWRIADEAVGIIADRIDRDLEARYPG